MAFDFENGSKPVTNINRTGIFAGPSMTCGPSMGRVFNHFFDDLYEQCSDHMAEKMPSSQGLAYDQGAD
jgi:hypothetical protein